MPLGGSLQPAWPQRGLKAEGPACWRRELLQGPPCSTEASPAGPLYRSGPPLHGPLRAPPRGSGGLSAAQLPPRLVSGQQTTHPLPPQLSVLAPRPPRLALLPSSGAGGGSVVPEASEPQVATSFSGGGCCTVLCYRQKWAQEQREVSSCLTRVPHGALCVAVGDRRAASSCPRGSVSPAHHEAACLLAPGHKEPKWPVSLTACSPTTLFPCPGLQGWGAQIPTMGHGGG